MIRETFVLMAVLAIATIANCQQVSINTTTEPATGTPVSNHSNGVPSTGSNPPASSPLIVTPAELDNQLQIFSAVYNASSLVRYYCNKSDYLTQYFGLNIINCDYTKMQAAQSGTAPVTCPAGCAAGVVKVGATCSAVYELAYTQLMALQQGLSFNLSNVNPYGISSLCQIPLSQEELNAFYQTGLIQHFYNKVRASDPSIPCDPAVIMSDATTLSIAQCELALAQSPGTCPSNCTSLISKIGASCLATLANKVASMDPTAYSTTYNHLQACGITASAPIAAPTSPPPVLPQPVTYPPPVPKQTSPAVTAPVAGNRTSGAPRSGVFVALFIIAASIAMMLV